MSARAAAARVAAWLAGAALALCALLPRLRRLRDRETPVPRPGRHADPERRGARRPPADLRRRHHLVRARAR